MGINQLKKNLKKYCGEDVIQPCLTKDLVGFGIRVVALDISIFLYKYIRTRGKPDWIHSMIDMICMFRKDGVMVISIFDGPNPPEEKKTEQEKRRTELAKLHSNIDRCETLSNEIKEAEKQNKEITPELKQEIIKLCGRTKYGDSDSVRYECHSELVDLLHNRKMTLEVQAIPITREDSSQVKEFLDIIGMPYIECDGEAETLCAWLCIHKHVDAVVSEDTDVLTYGTPIFLCDVASHNGTMGLITYESVLNGMDLTHKQFVDYCIVSRCDYNKHEKGVTGINPKSKKTQKIGPAVGLDLIKKYGDFEGIEENRPDIDLKPLKYERCRELFHVPNSIGFVRIPRFKSVQKERLHTYLEKINSRRTQTELEEIFGTVEFEFD